MKLEEFDGLIFYNIGEDEPVAVSFDQHMGFSSWKSTLVIPKMKVNGIYFVENDTHYWFSEMDRFRQEYLLYKLSGLI